MGKLKLEAKLKIEKARAAGEEIKLLGEERIKEAEDCKYWEHRFEEIDEELLIECFLKSQDSIVDDLTGEIQESSISGGLEEENLAGNHKVISNVSQSLISSEGFLQSTKGETSEQFLENLNSCVETNEENQEQFESLIKELEGAFND